MKLPTEEQLSGYFEDYKVPKNIKDHCFKVKEVALFIAKKVKENGVEVNLKLVNSLALLHDLFKIASIKELKPSKFHSYVFNEEETKMWKNLRENFPGMHEGQIAYVIFYNDFPELALALKNLSTSYYGDSSIEESIAHYSDWRVFKEEVVLLSERFAYLKERYLKEDEFWDEKIKRIKYTEEKLSLLSNLDLKQLKNKMEEEV